MELPIVEFPGFVNELSEDFRTLFRQNRTFIQFKRIITGMILGEKCSIAHMNGLFTEHTDQSNLNRMVTSCDWNVFDLNRIKVEMINKVDRNGVVVLDDYITEKYGQNIYGTDYYKDHAKKRTVFGQQVADCVYSGKGIFPLLSTIYIGKESKWLKGQHLTKIDIQIAHLTQLVEMGLDFDCVVFDCWYHNRKLIEQIERLGKDWVGQVKSNRLIHIDGEWISVSEYARRTFPGKGFKMAKVGNDTYLVRTITVEMKGLGKVRLMMSWNKHENFRFYSTNRLNWNELTILKKYCRRWDIEVWHREGKTDYGLKDSQLRSDGGASKYLALSSCADTFLEIASLLSPMLGLLKRRGCTPGLKQRWVMLEMLKSLIWQVGKDGRKVYHEIVEGILNPYRSTKRKRFTFV